ncbi:uncharacterized protein LOC129974889 [Argiope bruennichi]|uniref:uncharacterized protein LOC129974889 n=1 Tax=Argiope bruennichi TaxID=94029 RepID=UPI002495490C|nr:uncharacterized protein LOC129974889 [Argiope bruennichi]
MRGNVLKKYRWGRPRKLNDRDARTIVRKVKKNPKISAPKLANQIATASGKKVHPETVPVESFDQPATMVEFLDESRSFHLLTNKRDLILLLHILTKILIFGKQMFLQTRVSSTCSGVMAVEKSGGKKNTEMNPENLTPTMKHSGGSVMVWGAMAAAEVGNLVFIDGIMNQFEYLKILQDNLLPSVRKFGLGSNFVF